MSSTNRGYQRHKSDYYVTPQADVKLFLDHFVKDFGVVLAQEHILDCCAGGSERDEMSYPAVLIRDFGCNPPDYLQNLYTMDIREDSRADDKCDYLTEEIIFKPSIIITNPPFSLAVPIIEKALRDVQGTGYVIMLQRLNFFGSQERKPFWDANMPVKTYVHHKRIDFIPDWLKDEIKAEKGKRPTQDSIEYAHFVWQKGIHPEHTLLKVI